MPHQTKHYDYLLSDDPALLEVDAVHAYLARSYWCENIPREVVALSLKNSLCLGIYAPEGEQVGLLRVISDYATFAYLCDVYVLEPHRKLGLATAALQLLQTHPKLQGLRRFQLITQDAHTLYEKFGFSLIEPAGRHMEKCDRDVYRRQAGRDAPR
ncbi:MAG: GNAT family N-acetyltransferase [Opitutaceae bacterium]